MTLNQFIHGLRDIIEDWDEQDVTQQNESALDFMESVAELFRRFQAEGRMPDVFQPGI